MAVVLLLAIFSIDIIQGYFIQRRIDHNKWNTLNDSIVIPDSTCTSGGASQCLSLGARHAGHCRCECEDKSMTFVFLNGTWSCTKNKEIRQITGCPMKLASNVEPGFELFTVPSNPKVTIEYTAPIPGFDPLKCGFYRKNEYLLCDGKWKEFDRKSFDISGKDNAKLIVIRGSFPYGRVMKIYITCYNRSPSKEFSILLKVEGTQNCSSTKPSTAAPPATTHAITTSSLPISNPVSIPARSFSEQTSAPSSTIQTTTQPITILSTKTEPSLKNENRPQPPKTNAGVIAGAIGGVVILVVLLVVLLLIVIKRRRKVSVDELLTSPDVARNTKKRSRSDGILNMSEIPVPSPTPTSAHEISNTNQVIDDLDYDQPYVETMTSPSSPVYTNYPYEIPEIQYADGDSTSTSQQSHYQELNTNNITSSDYQSLQGTRAAVVNQSCFQPEMSNPNEPLRKKKSTSTSQPSHYQELNTNNMPRDYQSLQDTRAAVVNPSCIQPEISNPNEPLTTKKNTSTSQPSHYQELNTNNTTSRDYQSLQRTREAVVNPSCFQPEISNLYEPLRTKNEESQYQQLNRH